ncbi:MAG: response regulator [Pseudomonadota bacterium]
MGSQGPASGSRDTTSKRRILIVDDDADSADLLVQMLEMRGHLARSVNTASQAVATAAEFQPEVAILDVGLPDMSGYELASLLRRSEGSTRCKLIAVTGYSGEAVRARSKVAGFDLHLVKPVDLELLARSVLDDVVRDELGEIGSAAWFRGQRPQSSSR